MRKLLKGNMAQKIIIVLIIAILCNFIIPNYSHALDGNILIDPLKMFFAFIGDCAITIVQWSMCGTYIGATGARAKPLEEFKDNWATNGEGEIDWPTILISPEEIITGKVSILNANFIKGSNREEPGNYDGDDEIDYAEAGSCDNMDSFREEIMAGKKISTHDTEVGMVSLRTTISQWYNLLRNISAAALFCVLIYMGIRMVLSSASDEKAKYKKMMVDWLIAMCILFFLHYIMAMIMFATDKIVDVIGGGLGSQSYNVAYNDKEQKFNLSKEHDGKTAKEEVIEGEAVPKSAKVWNLMEVVRVFVSANDRGLAFSYLLLYYALIVLTYIFIFKYIKRFMTIALLTLIAPIIAVTYPIDKVKDGQAQAFSMWLREYIFNALLQPVHLLIYMVLIGSAIDLVKSNLIYAIVAMTFIFPAEKLIKSMFGFDKASTTDGIGSFAKGAVFAKAASTLAKGGKSSSNSKTSSDKIRQSNNKPDSGRDSVGLSDAYGTSENYAGLNEGSNDTSNNINMASLEDGSNEAGTNMNYSEKLKNMEKTFVDTDKPQTEKASTNMNNTEQLENIPKTFKDTDKDTNRSKNTTKAEKKPKRQLKKPKAFKGVGNVIATGAKYVTKNKGKIAKAALKGAGGLAGAAFGTGAAIVTGDTSHIATGVAAGVGVGSLAASAASGVAGVASGVVNTGRSIRKAYREGTAGEETAEKKERYNKFIKDNENIEAFQKQFKNSDGSKLSRRQAKDKMEEARDFIEAGYTDAKEIKKLMKMRNSDPNVTSNQVMAAHQQGEKFGADYFMDDKKIDNLENDLRSQLEAEGMNKGEAKKNAQKHINLMAMSQGRAKIDWKSRNEAKQKLEDEKKEAEARAKADAERNAKFQEAIINLANSSKDKNN